MPPFKSERVLHAWHFDAPRSSDPLLYDASAHHVCFTSVFSSLVTQYSIGKFTGILAESWSASADFKVWRFKIRTNLTFDDGTPITPNIILDNFKRVSFLMSKRNSHSDFFDNLEGYDRQRAMHSEIAGLRVLNENILEARFRKPVPNLLETISFGTYGLIHPKSYDHNDGTYLEPTKIIGSGRYTVVEWQQQKLVLNLRHDFLPDVYPKNNFDRIEINWPPEGLSNADLISHFSTYTAPSTHRFYAPPSSGILYLYAVNFKNTNSPFWDSETRILFREELYKTLRASDKPLNRSFFPLAMSGVEEVAPPTENPTPKNKARGQVLNVRFRPSVLVAAPYLGTPLRQQPQSWGFR